MNHVVLWMNFLKQEVLDWDFQTNQCEQLLYTFQWKINNQKTGLMCIVYTKYKHM